MHRTGWPLLLAGLAVALATPVLAREADYPRPVALEGSGVAWSGDSEIVTADPVLYRDTPVYLNNPPIGRVIRWAEEQPAFEEAWIDRDNFGWITVGFSRDADARQADLERKFPELGVVAVELPHTAKELEKLQGRLMDGVFPALATSGGASRGVPYGMVGLHTNVVNDELIAFLEAEFAGEPFCLDGPDPAAIVQPGPQPTQGDGWQLLGVHQQGPPWFQTGIAAGPGKLQALWAKANMPGAVPEVDFEQNVVVWFAEPHGSSCDDLRLDDVVVDHGLSLVYPLVVKPDNPSMCTADLSGAYQYLVTLERERLPAPPFFVQLGSDDPPGGMPKERTVVESDLRGAGSTAGKGGIHRDTSKPTPRPIESGGFRSGNTPYRLDTTCGISYFGELNGIDWVGDETELPAAWQAVQEPDGSVLVTTKMRGRDDPFLDATANGKTVRYLPWRGEPPVCEA